ncbi:MAG TPA: hypothetical protein VGG48_19805 [Rhizomicrobium sp.]|jgi:hypothetical protein
MANENDPRTERIAAGLERQFQAFDAKFEWAMARFADQNVFTDYHVRYATSLMKTCAQLAGTIARLDAQTARAQSKNSSSIPQ